jgi:hypothetical protein
VYTVVKWLVVVVLVLVLVSAAPNERCRDLALSKTLEGFAGGVMAAIVLTVSKILAQERPPGMFTLRRASRLVRQRVGEGLVGGLLVGLVLASVLLIWG